MARPAVRWRWSTAPSRYPHAVNWAIDAELLRLLGHKISATGIRRCMQTAILEDMPPGGAAAT